MYLFQACMTNAHVTVPDLVVDLFHLLIDLDQWHLPSAGERES